MTEINELAMLVHGLSQQIGWLKTAALVLLVMRFWQPERFSAFFKGPWDAVMTLIRGRKESIYTLNIRVHDVMESTRESVGADHSFLLAYGNGGGTKENKGKVTVRLKNETKDPERQSLLDYVEEGGVVNEINHLRQIDTTMREGESVVSVPDIPAEHVRIIRGLNVMGMRRIHAFYLGNFHDFDYFVCYNFPEGTEPDQKADEEMHRSVAALSRIHKRF